MEKSPQGIACEEIQPRPARKASEQDSTSADWRGPFFLQAVFSIETAGPRSSLADPIYTLCPSLLPVSRTSSLSHSSFLLSRATRRAPTERKQASHSISRDCRAFWTYLTGVFFSFPPLTHTPADMARSSRGASSPRSAWMTAFYLLCIFAVPLLLIGTVRAQEDTTKSGGDDKAISGPSTWPVWQG